ncbi:TIM barrel protein [Streptomyces sp. R302]|uniref:TIM barrel protein n=1 Tax=unclassified Streptomyces TaxID=2593676 RepID=UPI00145C87CA|nr:MULTISPECIES: TIM barrel protein [unclassified Streptomyces]NML52993.1 TIM barrel protein [Streptomyces sp. R301]NML78828.1 TIM barrel protein [Streptomyces sp. R302]
MTPTPTSTPATGIACTVRPWAQFPLRRALAGIRTAGFDAVALPVHGVTEVITPDSPAAHALEVGALIRDHGLRLVVLSHAADLDRDDERALATLRRQIDHCARLEVPTLVDMGCPEPVHGDRYLRLMAAAAPYAAAHGVTIAVKPHGGLTRSAADTLAVVERVGQDAFRACWDPGNLVHYGGEPPARGLAELAPYIAAVGVRDHPARGRNRAVTTGGMPPAITPGDGIVDFTGLYRTLREHGFAGPSAVESVTRLGTVEELDSEADRARRNVLDAMAGRVPDRPRPEPAIPARRSCSLVARTAAEDPIGTARPFDRFLMLELPLPWPPGMGTPVWETDRVPAALRSALRRATRRTEERGLTMKTFAAAPDPEYSTPGLLRIIRFDRAPGPAAPLSRTEHHVPTDQAPALIDALFAAPDADDTAASLAPFAAYRVTTAHRDLVVCTHASVDACCGTLGYPFYEQLRRAHGSGGAVRVWRISSFGGHRFAPTLVDFPEGRVWGNLTPDRMDRLVERTGDPADLMDLYRGWACLPDPGEQVLERELFRTYGWEWTSHHMSIHRTTDTLYHLTAHNPRTGTTHHHTAELHHLGPHPVLVGCDRVAGEVQRYTASLVTRSQGRP